MLHLIVTRIGFWFVDTTVKMASQKSMLDSVHDCVVLVEPDTNKVIFANQAAKDIAVDNVMNWSWELGVDSTRISIRQKSFARLDRFVFTRNLMNPEKAL